MAGSKNPLDAGMAESKILVKIRIENNHFQGPLVC